MMHSLLVRRPDPSISTFAGVMREVELKREKKETLKLIAKKKQQQEEKEVAPKSRPRILQQRLPIEGTGGTNRRMKAMLLAS